MNHYTSMDELLTYKTEILIEEITHLREDESVQIIADETADVLMPILLRLLGNKGHRNIRVTKIHSQNTEPTFMEETLEDVSTIFLFTAKNYTFSEIFRKFFTYHGKLVSCPFFSVTKYLRGIADQPSRYQKLMDNSTARFTPGSTVEITSPEGSTLKGKLGRVFPLCANFTMKGDKGLILIPSGIMGTASDPESFSGEALINGFVKNWGPIGESAIIKIIKGIIVDIQSRGNVPVPLANAMRDSIPLSEIGLGFNLSSPLSYDTHQSESEFGIIDLGFGENKHIGGYIEGATHLDLTIRGGSLTMNGENILRKGIFEI